MNDSMQFIARGTAIVSRPGTDAQSCAFPGICVLPSGRWLCTCRGAPAKGANRGQQVLITWSDDRGAHWSPPVRVFNEVPPVNGCPGLFRGCYCTALGGSRVLALLGWVDMTDPDLPFFNEKTEGLLDMRLFLAQSADGGETWTTPALIRTPPFDMPTPLTGPILLLANGDWACQYELNKTYYDPGPWRHSSVLSFSHDQGRTWPDPVRVSDDPELRYFYWDQRPSVLPDGRILDLFWTFDRQTAQYLAIHARESGDHGRTWSDLWNTGVPGQPAPPAALRDGRLVMVYVDRTAEPTIKLRVSADGGRSWPVSTEAVLYRPSIAAQNSDKHSMQDAWSEMGKFSVGLPATAALPDGDLLVVYYAGSETDRTNIEWVRVRIR